MDGTVKLVQSIIDGDAGAWTALQGAIDPVLVGMVRSHRAMREKGLLAGQDDVADVRAAALRRLSANQFANLRSFMARNPEGPRAESFHAWLYGLVDYAVRDHVRSRFGRAPKTSNVDVAANSTAPASTRALQSNAGQLDDEIEQRLVKGVGVTTRLTVGEILAFVARTFSAAEVKAVELHYGEGRDYAEIASELGLQEPLEAKRLLRRLNARLRYRFVEQCNDPRQ